LLLYVLSNRAYWEMKMTICHCIHAVPHNGCHDLSILVAFDTTHTHTKIYFKVRGYISIGDHIKMSRLPVILLLETRSRYFMMSAY
jgi:hypothetical protein